eukprot:2045247-Rhodomonas_salina.1
MRFSPPSFNEANIHHDARNHSNSPGPVARRVPVHSKFKFDQSLPVISSWVHRDHDGARDDSDDDHRTLDDDHRREPGGLPVTCWYRDVVLRYWVPVSEPQAERCRSGIIR